MADEKPKADAVANDEFIFDLSDQPTIRVKLKDGKVKEFAADLAMLEMLQAGIGTKEMESDPDTVKKICEIVQGHIGEPVGPGMATAIISRMTLLMRDYRKKATATPGSDTTSESGSPSTSEPAP